MTSPSLPTPAHAAGFVARTPWSATSATAISIAILLTAGAAAVAAGLALFELGPARTTPPGSGAQRITLASTMLAMGVMQATIIALVWWASGWFGGDRRTVLSLDRPLAARTFLIGLAGMVAILAPYNLAVYVLWPNEFTQDLRPFSEVARSSSAWIAAVVFAVGAPLSEELLFRGFLLPALARATARALAGIALVALLAQLLAPLLSRAISGGPIPWLPAGELVFGVNLILFLIAALAERRPAHPGGAAPVEAGSAAPAQAGLDARSFALAAVFTTVGWTAMHAGYSALGLTEVLIVGLYFCWLMWRHGSLWLVIVLHGLYNALQMAILMLVPLPAPA